MSYLDNLKAATDFKLTENGAIAHSSTGSNLYDLFAFGGAYRNRTVEDCLTLFVKAFNENPTYAMKCLFYLRDVRGGQGERRFFREVVKYLAIHQPEVMKRNLQYIPEFGRWDDLYMFVDTPLMMDAFALIKEQLALDVQCKTPSLLAKWLKSENTSSDESRMLGNLTRMYLKMSHKQYRKTLSILRERINVLERLMSAGRWDEIEFEKIPSKAGLVYKNAFARRDVIKAKYEAFAKDTSTKVNAATLYPYEVVRKALDNFNWRQWTSTDTDRAMINKYWDNLTDYFNGATLNALAVVDTSGSMTCTYGGDVRPIDVAISLGLYCAQKAQGPFHNHYISFASRPQMIDTTAPDFCQAVYNIYKTNLVDNTNLEAAFGLLLNTAITHHTPQSELPETLIVISDMEIDEARYGWGRVLETPEATMETIKRSWAAAGYKCPNLVYWNVNARNNTILDKSADVSYVSGCSPVIFEQIMKGKTGYDLMMDKLNDERYSCIK